MKKLKYKIRNNKKTMKNKSKELNKFLKLFISESMYLDDCGLFFNCRKWKRAKNIFNTWFFNNAINVQLTQNGKIQKIFHTKHLAMLLKVNGIDFALLNL